MGLRFSIGAAAPAVMAELMARLQEAEAKADTARAKADAADAAAAQAKTDAAAAQATGTNARQMVLNRDATLTALTSGQTTLAQQQASLESLAATLGAAIPAAEATHAQQWVAINAVTAQASDLATQIATLTNRVTGIGVTTTPLLALAANVDVTVPLSRTMPNLGYSMDWATSLPRTSYTVTEKSRTTSSVTLSLKATVAVGAGVIVVLVRS